MVQLLVAVLAVAGGAFVVGLGLLRRDRARLEAATRAALIDAVAAGVVHEGGEARVRAQGTLDELVHAVGLAVRACRAVRDDRASPTSLAASDPDPRVRLLALRRARGPEVTRDWLRARREDPSVVVACEAALRSGEDGIPWLLEQLAAPDRRVAALHALARGPIAAGDPRLLDALAAELPGRSEPLWLDLAGRVGTVALVPVLRRLGGVDAVHAVRRIQARASGEAGAVSVADAAGGALSEPGGDGHLSEPT